MGAKEKNSMAAHKKNRARVLLLLGKETCAMLDALTDYYDQEANRSATMRLLIKNAHVACMKQRREEEACGTFDHNPRT